MPEFLLLVVIALVVAALVFGVGALVTGADPGLTPTEPEGESRGLPSYRPLGEADFSTARFDTAWRGYRMSQVDAAMARAAYDIGFKQEMIEALRAEVTALREGRTEDAEILRKARETATGGNPTAAEFAGEAALDSAAVDPVTAGRDTPAVATPGELVPGDLAPRDVAPGELTSDEVAPAPAEPVKQQE